MNKIQLLILQTFTFFLFSNVIFEPFVIYIHKFIVYLKAICLLMGQFIVPEINNYASIILMALLISITATSVLEMQWGGFGIHG